ncbi:MULTISPECIES: Dps family protein [Sphingomonas]|uniref:DNA starvation/stationary phase protection protein n=1 Tax=Sphingomonas kyungheensis TaxID=1069987 RepID=A0ABU8H354_9SPHN|nr:MULTISPECIES: DNA starvation/stationary phase protection protein [unclassified Sphingomonas]EZP52824.1 Ferritin-like domain protein [Sphingomonas sp. RIT328]
MRYTLLAATLFATAIASPAIAQQGATGGFPTNSLSDRPHGGPQGADQRASIQALQQTLTELQQLQLQTKQAHWNVSGTLYYPLHELLQDHYEGVGKYADEVAERLLAIGASSDGRANTIVRTSRIPEYPGGFTDDAQVIGWFARYYLTTSTEIGQGIKATEDKDPTTSNLLQEVQHAIDKYQWQMRAMIQPTPTDPNTGADLNAGRPIMMPGAGG